MKRRAKFALAAEAWFDENAVQGAVDSDTLWIGLKQRNPDLTTPSASRKTPRGTCMRDLRHDSRFKVGQGKISLV
jgi:hypothetical protein